MTDMRVIGAIVLTLWAAVAGAEELRIGVLGLDPDPRRDEAMAYARIALTVQGDPALGAVMAVGDMAVLTEATGWEVTLDIARAADAAGLIAEAERMAAAGAGYIVLDLPAADADALATGLGGGGPVLLNATAPEDWLRRTCHPSMLHVAASDRMISDALAQHMAVQQWDSVLILQGRTERDLVRADSFAEAAGRLRIEVADRREFDLSTNPALREQNNIRLLTSGVEYDVVFIADEVGEFSRYVPYQTMLPRPVMGSTGLVALEWHWALERYGAPQVNARFEDITREAEGAARRMGWQDWTVWAATRAVILAHVKARDTTPEGIAAHLRSDRLSLDGSKGAQMSFRDWDGQLRQPILLATANAIIAVAPLEGFLHQGNTLDSLGTDAPEFLCD
jgi:ABC transporter substrate binding protein (PQQ-dependent alcohol dehydrogenase system)